VLFFIGLERRQKYRVELQSLILGKWDKLQDTKASANGGAAPKPAGQETTFRKTTTEEVVRFDPSSKPVPQERKTITQEWSKVQKPPQGATDAAPAPASPKTPAPGDPTKPAPKQGEDPTPAPSA
jgi:hypothetical protein